MVSFNSFIYKKQNDYFLGGYLFVCDMFATLPIMKDLKYQTNQK